MICAKGKEPCCAAMVNHDTKQWCPWGTTAEFLKTTCGRARSDWQWLGYFLLCGFVALPALPVALVLAAIIAVFGAVNNKAFDADAQRVEARLAEIAGHVLERGAAVVSP